MTNSLPLILLLALGPAAPSQTETRVLNAIQDMLRQGTAVSFSQLQNDPHFGEEEKEFIGRLFEILFRIPAFVESELERTGQPPKRAQIGERFGVGVQSIELLLTVMEIDRRVPKMFDRDQAGEITRVHRQGLAAFLQRHGNPVRVTGWEGKTAPGFDLLTLEGKRLSSESLRGSNALLYFWFTGCPPCSRISPILESLHQRYENDQLRVVGLNADRILELTVNDRERIEYLKKHGVSFPNVHLTPAAHEAYGNVNVFPTLFLLDSSGTVVRRLINYQSQETMDQVVSELVGP